MTDLQTLLRLARVAGVVLALVAAGAGVLWQDRQLHQAREQRDQLRADFEAYRAQAEQNTRKAVEAVRVQEHQTQTRQQEAFNAATQELAAARSDAAAARDAHDRLRQRAQALAAAAGRCVPVDPAPGQPGQAASAPADVLAELLDRAAGEARQLAEYADAARTAGRACERAYDALTAAPR